LYDTFKRNCPEGESHPRRATFERFRAQAGEALNEFCLFEALHAHFEGGAWPAWPTAYHDVNGRAVKEFAAAHRDAILYHAYLQWLAETQLAAAARECGTGAGGMAIGLYRDIAVGSDSNGADAWMMRDLYAQGSRIGAPPDAFNLSGQDWGTPPPRPEVSRGRAHAPFVAALRANMRHAGALRIDHAMALQQLYWIPPGAPASEGAYVRYPMDELFGLVALESHRNRCLVIGEDLGTVTDEFRARTVAESIYSYRVFYFERYAEGLFKRPDAYPELALATAGTHDLPTIRGHWVGRDVAWWAERNGDDAAKRKQAEDARHAERALIVSALADQGLVEKEFPLDATDEASVRRLIVAIQRFVARSSARLVMANLDDALTELEPLNIPGTVDEYPNWRRRHRTSVEELLDDPFVRELAAAVTAERRGG
jgi:4-alpha-glucanotransferase